MEKEKTHPLTQKLSLKKGIEIMLLFIVNYYLNLQKHNSF